MDGRDYATGDLSVGVHTLTAVEIASFSSCAQLNTVSPITSLIYTVTDAGNDSRRVDAQIIWPDP